MKKLFLPSQIFQLENEISKGLLSSLLKLRQVGYVFFTNEQPPSEFQKFIKNEGLSINVQKEIPADVLLIKYLTSHQKKHLELDKKSFNSISEVVEYLLMQKRIAEKNRTTNETSIHVKVNLDGKGKHSIKSGIGFFDHMLEQISRHSNIDLTIRAKGDLWVDEHHTVEDIGISLGEAIKIALGNKAGIKRYGYFVPMDDSVAVCSIDLGGRAYLNFNCKFKREKVGEFPTELVKEFFRGIVQGLQANIFIKAKGENDHHKIESIFKAFAKALNEACRIDERNQGMLPTTKGIL